MIGIFNVYKPSGMTSNAVIQKLKKHFKIEKIGHMGTLDPMACGLLPVGIGKATRLFDYLLEKTKTYRVIFDFGYETDTLDVTGQRILESNKLPSEIEIKQAISEMIGVCDQMPPKYSAKNINGKRAYDLARAGIDFELKPKQIEIYEFTLLDKIDNSKYRFDITCSSGTYIRAIGRDLAYKLGTYATMSYLERREMGVFNLENSVELETLLNCTDIDKYLLSPVKVMKNFDIIEIDDKTATDLINGKVIKYKEIKKNSFIICNNILIGIVRQGNQSLKIDTFLKE